MLTIPPGSFYPIQPRGRARDSLARPAHFTCENQWMVNETAVDGKAFP